MAGQLASHHAHGGTAGRPPSSWWGRWQATILTVGQLANHAVEDMHAWQARTVGTVPALAWYRAENIALDAT
eukprot:356317-Chlamydomonas_euryale.AAC.1